MTQEFEAGVINYFKTLFLEKMGLDIPFKYSPSMDFIEEFRKDRISKINNTKTTDAIKELIGEYNDNISLCVWKRDPIIKSEEKGHNWSSPVRTQYIEVDDEITLRQIFYGESNFTFQLFASESKIIYLIELLFNIEFSGVNPPIEIDYIIDDKIIVPINYNTLYGNIDSIEYIDIASYGSMTLIEFSVKIDGVFFSPFYELGNNKIEVVDLKVNVFNKSMDLKDIRQYNESTLACREVCNVNQDTRLIMEESCKSLNNINT